MKVKEFFSLFTSTKALILGSIAIITLVNELRLRVNMYEAKDNTEEFIEDEFDVVMNYLDRKHKEDSLNIIKLVDELSLQKGISINYSLIESNTQAAVTNGFNNAIAHNNMVVNSEKSKYDTLYYKTGYGHFYRVIHNIDTDAVHLIETIDNLPDNIKNE